MEAVFDALSEAFYSIVDTLSEPFVQDVILPALIYSAILILASLYVHEKISNASS